MVPHSGTLAWKIPWTEEPGRLQSLESLRVGHDWVALLSLFTFMHWRRKWQPTPVFLPGESQGRGAWWAAVYGVAQSQTWLKRLSSSNSSSRLLYQTSYVASLFAHQCQHKRICSNYFQNSGKVLNISTNAIFFVDESIYGFSNNDLASYLVCLFYSHIFQ